MRLQDLEPARAGQCGSGDGGIGLDLRQPSIVIATDVLRVKPVEAGGEAANGGIVSNSPVSRDDIGVVFGHLPPEIKAVT